QSKTKCNTDIDRTMFLTHPRLLQCLRYIATTYSYYRYDGTHLSKIANDIYLNNLQGALEKFMTSGGPAIFP
ncbi:Hypothetical predicted protein, partial [Mytilus galloprovincialis]